MSQSCGSAELISRRSMLHQSLVAVGGLALAPGWAGSELRAAAGAGVARSGYEPLNRFPRMVQESYVRRVRALAKEREARLAALQSRDDAEVYVGQVRERIAECFGPFPDKTPLNARVTGVVEREAYRIEKIIFESRPGFLVTANLYLPKGHGFPLPGVVGTCGHSDTGKAAEPYQAFSQGLARKGYVVLIFDPIGQGERLQYPGPDLRSRVGVGVREHLMAGNQQFLVGEFLGAWRAWDGVRALDYLLTREEVDAGHLGVTGNSGGGTMTTWLCGVERRWTMAAPSCFVTTFLRNLENELPADTEQCPPRALALGLEHEDFIAAMAPKPVILLAKERDFFDVRGTEAAYGRLRRLYGLLGAEDRIGLFTGPTAHGYSQENREAMYGWFNRWTGLGEGQSEPELVIEPPENLWCTPRGQVSEQGSRTVFSFTRERSVELRKQRQPLNRAELVEALQQTLGLQWRPRRRGARYRILRAMRSRGYPWPQLTTYAVETEPGIQTLVARMGSERHDARPPRRGGRAVLYVAHQSSDAELREEPLIQEIATAEPEATFYACDVRGVGESRPDICGQNMFLHPYGSDYFCAIHAMMLGEPYVGRKTHDVLRVLAWLRGVGHSEIHLVGVGWGALPATLAAVFDEAVKRVTLKQALTSYADVAERELYGWPLSSFVPGVLLSWDLPDCYRVLESRQLRQIEPWGAAVD